MLNRYEVVGDEVRMRIKRRNGKIYTIICDLDDLPKLAYYTAWRVATGRCGLVFVTCTGRPANAPRRQYGSFPAPYNEVMLNRYLNNTPNNQECYHKDGNPLNFHKENLENGPHKEVMVETFKRVTPHRRSYRVYRLPGRTNAPCRWVFKLPSGKYKTHATQQEAIDARRRAFDYQN